MIYRILAVFALILALQSNWAAPANAQFPCGNFWGGLGYNLYIADERPPYFSLYPPVYYSYPVPRTYGWSPFAYPAGTMTPEIEISEAATVVNPHVAPQNGKNGVKILPAPTQPAVPTPADESSFRNTGMELPSRVQVVVNPYVIDAPQLGKK
ncbi:MAG: hypothetical protein SFX18_03225 [Pirellulales bacterium]|nr:hypothetical protein [Pirellulales bacterium]